jgi:ribonuclease D
MLVEFTKQPYELGKMGEFLVVTDTTQLHQIELGPVIGVDMEYSKDQVCLVQLKTQNGVFVLDVLAFDASAFLVEVFQSDAVKVMYGG